MCECGSFLCTNKELVCGNERCNICTIPITEEIRLNIFGFPDYTVSPYNQGTLVYSRENLFEILEAPMKTYLKVTGTPVKPC
jgi:hypothetical protein